MLWDASGFQAASKVLGLSREVSNHFVRCLFVNSFYFAGFIVGLERDYPSTASTIVRTCAKLAPKEGNSSICVLCER